MKKTLPTIAIILISLFSTAQPERLFTENENFMIYPSEVTQTEVFIVNSPLNPDHLFVSCNTLTFIPFFVSEGIYTSMDGGGSWQGSDSCSGDPLAFHGGDPGIAIDKDGKLILTRLGRSPFSGLYSHYSGDMGQSWSAQQVISTDDLERASVATDYFPGSPYYGRTYAVWVKFAPPFPLMMAYTDDAGISWSPAEAINNPPNRSAGGDICIGPGGEVYVCWAGVQNETPFSEIHAGFARSLNGGAGWEIQETAFPMSGITGLLTEKGNIRVNGLPGIAVDTTSGEQGGWIYIVTGQEGLSPAGDDPDIILNRSTDGGQSWSEGIRVNQDELSNGKIQYFPAVHVDKYGGLDIIFYDDRNTTSDSAGVFMARSTDGGNSWKEYEISDHNYEPRAIGGLGQGYQGDNIDLTSTHDRLVPVWMDNSSGLYQIWTVHIDFTSLDNITEANNSLEIELLPNRPNPFRRQTTIAYRLAEGGSVNIRVYDLNGKEVERLIDGYRAAGVHELTFNPERPGIYICRMSDGKQVLSRKMIALAD